MTSRTACRHATILVTGALWLGLHPAAIAGGNDAANEDGRLPQWDKGTRVVVFGRTSEQARTVASQVAKKAYWNSSFFGGSYDELLRANLSRPVACLPAR